MGNQAAREALSKAAEQEISEEQYEEVRQRQLALELVVKSYEGFRALTWVPVPWQGASRVAVSAAPAGNGRGRAKKETPAKNSRGRHCSTRNFEEDRGDYQAEAEGNNETQASDHWVPALTRYRK